MVSTALRQLISERDKLQAEIEALRHKVEGLEIAIRLVADETSRTSLTSESRPGVSETLVGLLRTAGETGLKPREAIEIAERDGKQPGRSVPKQPGPRQRTQAALSGSHLKAPGSAWGCLLTPPGSQQI